MISNKKTLEDMAYERSSGGSVLREMVLLEMSEKAKMCKKTRDYLKRRDV